MGAPICSAVKRLLDCVLGCIVRPTFSRGNLACISSHSLWQRHASHARFSPRHRYVLGRQMSTLGRGPRHSRSERGQLCDLVLVADGADHSLRTFLCGGLFFNVLNGKCRAGGSIIRACLSHSSCSGNMKTQLKGDVWKAFGPGVLRFNVLQKSASCSRNVGFR